MRVHSQLLETCIKVLHINKPSSIHRQLLDIHNDIANWYFGYYFGSNIPNDYLRLLDALCEKEYILACKIYGKDAIRLTFDNILYITEYKEVEWWIMWGLSIYRI